jgi:hypothetical protein
MSHAFSDTALREQEPILTTYFDLLISQLKARVGGPADGVVDLTQWFNFTTFDIIGDLVLAASFDALNRGVYHEWIERSFESVKLLGVLQLIATYPLLQMLADGLLKLFPHLDKARDAHIKYASSKTIKRINTETNRKDIMSYVRFLHLVDGGFAMLI